MEPHPQEGQGCARWRQAWCSPWSWLCQVLTAGALGGLLTVLQRYPCLPPTSLAQQTAQCRVISLNATPLDCTYYVTKAVPWCWRWSSVLQVQHPYGTANCTSPPWSCDEPDLLEPCEQRWRAQLPWTPTPCWLTVNVTDECATLVFAPAATLCPLERFLAYGCSVVGLVCVGIAWLNVHYDLCGLTSPPHCRDQVRWWCCHLLFMVALAVSLSLVVLLVYVGLLRQQP